MDGKQAKVEKYLSKLTGKSGKISIESLSSAQRARFFSWASVEKIEIDGFEKFLRDNVNQLGSPGTSSNDLLSIPIEKQSSILSIGVDLQSKTEMFPDQILDLKSDETLLKIFTLKEISYAENKADPYLTLTGIFCAKESIIEASSLQTNKLNEIEIKVNKEGKPYYEGFDLSISHSLDLAIAVAIKNSFSHVDSISKNQQNTIPELPSKEEESSQEVKSYKSFLWGWKIMYVLGFVLIFLLGYYLNEILLTLL